MKQKWKAVGIILLLVGAGIISSTGNGVPFTIQQKEYAHRSTMDGSPPDEIWNKTFGGLEDDGAYDVHQTPDGGYIMAGFIGPRYSHGDIMVVKTDSKGNMEWNKTYGGKFSDVAYSIQQTKDGGYIIVGHTVSLSSGTDLWMIKTDGQGNELWNKTHGGNQADSGTCVKQTTDGGYIMTGFTRSYGWAGTYDVWLLKTDENGTEEWNKTWGGPSGGNEDGHSVEQTPDEGYIITGNYHNVDTNDWDVYLIKTDENGLEEWTRTYGRKNFHEVGTCVQVTSDAGYIISGWIVIPNHEMDAWLIKTNEQGIEQWNRTFGGEGYDRGEAVYQTSNGGYVLTGSIASFGLFDLDVLLVETDCNGNTLWIKTLGKTGNLSDYGYSVKQTSDRGYIVAGATYSYGAGWSDLWLVYLDRFHYPPNPPSITGPIVGDPGIDYRFTLTTTDDEQEDIFYWVDWGDTTNSSWFGPYPSGIPVEVSHTYITPGDYEITAKAKDTDGYEGFWSSPYPIRIGNCAPQTPYVVGLKDGTTNVDYTFYMTPKDPEHDDVYCLWDWGDGSGTGWIGPYPSHETIEATHSWMTEGIYEIQVKLKDIYGSESNWSTPHVMTIRDGQPPEKPIIDGPSWGVLNISYTFSFRWCNPEGDDFYYQWEWGDGTTSGWLGPYSAGQMVSENHVWSQKGTYTIQVNIRDIYGCEIDSDLYFFIIYDMKNAFVFGRATNLTWQEDYILFEAVKLGVIFFSPFNFTWYASEEQCIIIKDKGWVNTLFVFAFCKMLIS